MRTRRRVWRAGWPVHCPGAWGLGKQAKGTLGTAQSTHCVRPSPSVPAHQLPPSSSSRAGRRNRGSRHQLPLFLPFTPPTPILLSHTSHLFKCFLPSPLPLNNSNDVLKGATSGRLACIPYKYLSVFWDKNWILDDKSAC